MSDHSELRSVSIGYQENGPLLFARSWFLLEMSRVGAGEIVWTKKLH